MDLFDKLTGTRRPSHGVVPRSPAEIRTELLGLNRPDTPYLVRYGAPEGTDLVAEWRILEPAWHTFFARTQVGLALQVQMRLVAANHEVRALDRQWEVAWAGSTPRLTLSADSSRGQVATTSRRWTIGRGSDGGLEATEAFRFDNSVLKKALQDAALGAGWTWRGVATGKL
ncbi:hypothetical protein AB0I22_39070 [Streptomyces sp. NPDC050610]|uniref:hypothetical protein n=1 Tax=Streptomyces sp. NPDC050610 TaxID=3157097 RepID=UPI003424F656